MEREPRADKVAVVDEVRERFEGASAVMLTEYRGIDVSSMQQLRRALTEDELVEKPGVLIPEPLGKRHRDNCVIQSEDAMRRPVYWLGPQAGGKDTGEGTDFHAIAENAVSITPLDVDMTAYQSFQQVSDWAAELSL